MEQQSSRLISNAIRTASQTLKSATSLEGLTLTMRASLAQLIQTNLEMASKEMVNITDHSLIEHLIAKIAELNIALAIFMEPILAHDQQQQQQQQQSKAVNDVQTQLARMSLGDIGQAGPVPGQPSAPNVTEDNGNDSHQARRWVPRCYYCGKQGHRMRHCHCFTRKIKEVVNQDLVAPSNPVLLPTHPRHVVRQPFPFVPMNRMSTTPYTNSNLPSRFPQPYHMNNLLNSIRPRPSIGNMPNQRYSQQQVFNARNIETFGQDAAVLVCYKCRCTGHVSRNCPMGKPSTSGYNLQWHHQSKPRKCYTCKQIGHSAPYCRNNQRQAEVFLSDNERDSNAEDNDNGGEDDDDDGVLDFGAELVDNDNQPKDDDDDEAEDDDDDDDDAESSGFVFMRGDTNKLSLKKSKNIQLIVSTSSDPDNGDGDI